MSSLADALEAGRPGPPAASADPPFGTDAVVAAAAATEADYSTQPSSDASWPKVVFSWTLLAFYGALALSALAVGAAVA